MAHEVVGAVHAGVARAQQLLLGQIGKGIAGGMRVAEEQEENATARALYEECLTLQQELGARQGIALSLGNLGSVAENLGEVETARQLYTESLAIHRELGDRPVADEGDHLEAAVVGAGGGGEDPEAAVDAGALDDEVGQAAPLVRRAVGGDAHVEFPVVDVAAQRPDRTIEVPVHLVPRRWKQLEQSHTPKVAVW